MSEVRTYTRKLKALAFELNNRVISIKAEAGSDKYEEAFKYFNDKWKLFCKSNLKNSVKPSHDAFEKYIKLCQ